MSVSPQSLARTRDKRSLRIPRKFEDFSLITSCDIPPTPPPPAPAKAPSPRTTSPRPSNPKKKSKGQSLMAKSSRDEQSPQPDPKSETINTTDKAVIKGVESASTINNPVQSGSPDHDADSQSNPAQEVADEPDESPPPPEDLEAKTKQPQSLARTRDKRSLRIPRKFEDFSLVTSCDIPPISSPPEPVKVPSPKAPSPKAPSPKVPSPKDPPPKAPSPSPSSASSSSPMLPNSNVNKKKKSKGLSLMVKPQGNQTAPAVNKISASINNTGKVVIKGISSAPTSLVTIPQQNNMSMYINNLMPNMHYNTRLMINEPIYLPRSVAPIAPITTTPQQIANWLQEQTTN